MGQQNNQPDHINPGDSRTAEDLLRSMTQDLRTLQQDLVTQLHQDVQRLQAEKSRLISDIEQLQTEQQRLQTNYETALSRQQLAQQQAWAKQLALALANHLHTALAQRLSQSLDAYPMQRTLDVAQVSLAKPVDADHAHRVLASIDETVSRAFESLNHDLNSYQSVLSQQINRMHDLGQQGETILEALVNRISQQLQSDIRRTWVDDRNPAAESIPAGPNVGSNVGSIATPTTPATPGYTTPPPYQIPSPSVPAASTSSRGTAASPLSNPEPIAPSPPPSQEIPPFAAAVPPVEDEASPAATPRRPSPFQIGVMMILFSTIFLALHHVTVQIIGTSGNLFGSTALPIGGYASLDSFSNSLLLLWMRMVFIVPLMAWLGRSLYQPVWRDIKSLLVSRDRRVLWSLVGSGAFLLLSQVFLYIAISEVGPAVAVAISSIYPLATIPLMWLLFSDRPTRFRIAAIATILVGVGLSVYATQTTLSDQGIVAGAISGITFALYLVSMMIINRRKMNPVPISLVQNVTIFVLSSIFLITVGTKATPTSWGGVVLGGFVLGGLTVLSYFLNSLGARLLGAARATIIAASLPTITALLAFLVFPSAKNSLSLGQILGVLVVTLGIAALSFERIISAAKVAAKPSK